MKRTPEQQRALVVRILDERHVRDVYERAVDELGRRARTLGPLDLSRNPLRAWVTRIGTAYLVPPLVDALAEPLATILGDASARVTVARYEAAGGRPMPTPQVVASARAARYWLGAGYAGVRVDWSERAERVVVEAIQPDDLDLEYASDDPTEPTRVTHRTMRKIGRNKRAVREVYDLADLEAPTYRVYTGDGGTEDVTEVLFGRRYDGEAYWWRYDDGTPFCPIVVLGDDRRPYETNGLVEVTLRAAVLWSHWSASIRDAGHPQRNAIGLHVDGQDADASTGQTGVAAGPEDVIVWHHDDPERPGSLHQWGPGFDPEITGRAIRSYEASALSALGLPVDLEKTGGEPTATEQRVAGELVAATFSGLRVADGEVLRRAAATANRASGTALDERRYGVLYRDEIAEAIASAQGGQGDDGDEEREGDRAADGRGDRDGAPGADREGAASAG